MSFKLFILADNMSKEYGFASVGYRNYNKILYGNADYQNTFRFIHLRVSFDTVQVRLFILSTRMKYK